MIPIGDSVQSRTFPYANVALIAINIVVFLYELTLNTVPPFPGGLSELDRFFFEWGSLPACLGSEFGAEPNVPQRDLAIVCSVQDSVALTPFTSMFIHGGWLHLIGNMIFLWVFGDNVEDAMGHVRYAVFYLLVGLGATAAHTAVNQNDLIPAIGASGAIAGVLGAYLLLYPRATVAVLLPIFFFIPFSVPAIFLIGFWFFLQVFNGVTALTATNVVNAGGGVAWFAHIGGFVAGLLLVKLFVVGRSIPPPRPVVRRWRDDW